MGYAKKVGSKSGTDIIFKMFKTKKFQKWSALILIVLSLGFAAWQMIYLAKNESATTDEKVHVPAGFSYLKYKTFVLNPEHPPLSKLLVALPVYLSNPNVPDTTELFSAASDFYYDSWYETRTWGENLLFNAGNNTQQIIFSSRLVNIILCLILILFIGYWGYKIGSWPVAAVAVVLASFQPLFLAHGHLANTDLLMALAFVLLSFGFWQSLKTRQIGWYIFSAFALALAAITKFTFVIFIPTLLIAYFVNRRLESKKDGWGKIILGIILFVVVGYAVVAACYHSVSLPPKFDGIMSDANHVFNMGPDTMKALEYFRLIASPALFYKGLFMVLGHVAGGHDAYLFGQFSHSGWWYYFLTTVLLKTPIGLLALFGWGLANIKKFWKKDRVLQIVLLVGIFGYLIFASVSRANLGQRHIMPIYPLIIVFASQLVLVLKNNWSKVILTILVVSVVLSVAYNFRNQIAYFNELVGGAKNGYKYLLDSNYDWGQSLPAIAKYVKARPQENFYLRYEWESPGEQAAYGLDLPDLQSFDGSRDALIIIDPGNYVLPENAWLKNLEIVDRIDNTLFVLRYNAGIKAD